MRKYKHGGDNMNKEVGNGNLKPFEKGKVSREKAVEAGKKGGKASAEAKKKKKKLRELCEMFGELPYSGKAKNMMKEISEEDMTNKMAIVVGVFKKAMGGDVQAFNAIRDICGEKPKDEIDSKVATNVTVNYVKSGVKFASSEDEVNDER